VRVLDGLRRRGVDVLLKVGSTDWDLPNVYAVGRAPDDDLVVATACGEAVHPDRDVAVRKALLELASSRVRKRFQHGPLDALRGLLPDAYVDSAAECVDLAAEEQRVLDATVRWLSEPPERWERLLDRTLFRRDTLEPVTALPTATPGGPAELVADLVRRLAAGGLEVLVADLASADGVSVVKVVVPGLEVETVAYGRIGERNAARLLAEGRDDLVRQGACPGERWRPVQLTPAAVDRLGGPVWLEPDALAGLTADLLPLYREPGRHAAPVAVARGGRAARP
jgi:ribosomal protein S12 methylthiotransferase accessory factor